MSPRRRREKPSTLATVAILAIAVAVLYLARDVLIPITLAVLLSFLLGRPVSWLERRRWPRVVSVLAVVSVAFLAIGAVGYVVGQQVVSLATNLGSYQAEIANKAKSLRGTGSGWTQKFERFSRDIQKASETPASQPTSRPEGTVAAAAQDIAADPSKAAARPIVNGPPTSAPAAAGLTPANPLYVTQSQGGTPVDTLLALLENVGGPLGTAAVVIVFVIFMLLEREAMRDRFIAVVSRGNYTVTTRAIDDAAERISRYLVAQSIVNGSYGLIIATGLFLIGLFFGHGVWFPSFVLWGLLCAVLRFIPYAGPAISSLFPVVLALAVYPGFTVAVAVVVLFVVIEMISNNVMEPWLYGASTGLSNVAILVAAIFWTWLWGSVGLLVATPLTVCLAVIGKYVTPLKFLHILLGDEDALPPSVRFYQRLLADDRPDAERVVLALAGDRGAHAVADDVYLPALRLARRDRLAGALTADDETRIFDDTLLIVRPPGKLVEPEPVETPAIGCPRVLACPAHHRADEITMYVLAEALLPLGAKTTVMSTRSLPLDVERAVERDRPAVVVLGIVPPGGLPQATYLCRRLRKKFPDLPILVGYWGRSRNFDKLLVRLRKAGASYVLTSVEQTKAQVSAMLPKPPAESPAEQSVANPS